MLTIIVSVEDESRKNENKDNKWFKTPNEVTAKTRPRFVSHSISVNEHVCLG